MLLLPSVCIDNKHNSPFHFGTLLRLPPLSSKRHNSQPSSPSAKEKNKGQSAALVVMTAFSFAQERLSMCHRQFAEEFNLEVVLSILEGRHRENRVAG